MKPLKKLFGFQWPLVLWSTYDHLLTENGSLKRHLLETQRELAKHKMLLGGLASSDEVVARAFDRARAAARKDKS